MSIKIRLLIIMSIIIILTLILSTIQNIFYSYYKTIDYIKERNLEDAKTYVNQFQMLFKDRESQLYSHSLLASGFIDGQKYFNFLTENCDSFDALIFINSNGNNNVIYNKNFNIDVKNIYDFLASINLNSINKENIHITKVYSSKPFLAGPNEYGIMFISPVLLPNSSNEYLVGIVSLKAAGDKILYHSIRQTDAKPFAISGDGYKVLSHDSKMIGKRLDDPLTKPTKDAIDNYTAMSEGKTFNNYHISYFRNSVFSPDLKPSKKILSSYPLYISDDFKFSIGVPTEISNINFFNKGLIAQMVISLLSIISLISLTIYTYKQVYRESMITGESEASSKYTKELEFLNTIIIEQNTTLEKMNNELKEYNKVKNDYFVNVSHELRMPLTVIISTIQLMEKNSLSEQYSAKTSKWIKLIRQNAQRLSRLVNNILTVIKLDSGSIVLDKKNTDIVKLLFNIITSVEPFVENKGLKLFFESSYAKKIVLIDRDKIEKVVLNLLSNAIKFNVPNGKIFVRLVCDTSIKIEIEDTGIGIPQEKIKTIFNRFIQLNSMLTREHDGLGVGLSLCKELVKLHRGEILVESTVSKGSKFTIVLPNEKTEYIKEDDSLSSENSVSIELSDIC